MALSLRQEEWAERQCGRSEGCSCTSRDREEGGRDNKTLQTEENKLGLCFLRVVSNYTCVCVYVEGRVEVGWGEGHLKNVTGRRCGIRPVVK